MVAKFYRIIKEKKNHIWRWLCSQFIKIVNAVILAAEIVLAKGITATYFSSTGSLKGENLQPARYNGILSESLIRHKLEIYIASFTVVVLLLLLLIEYGLKKFCPTRGMGGCFSRFGRRVILNSVRAQAGLAIEISFVLFAFLFLSILDLNYIHTSISILPMKIGGNHESISYLLRGARDISIIIAILFAFQYEANRRLARDRRVRYLLIALRKAHDNMSREGARNN